MHTNKIHIPKNAIKLVVACSTIIMGVKFAAFYITHSNAVFSDALESIINVLASLIAWYSIHYASKPKDSNHPYGHGKIEFLAAGFEGGLIAIAGLSIIYRSVIAFIHPQPIHQLDLGMGLTALAGIANYIVGGYLVRVGKRYHSISLEADGKHIQSDTYTSIGLVAGMGVLRITGLLWIDSVVAIVFACIILISGYRLIRKSLSGLLDEADEKLVARVLDILRTNRSEKWIDVHNLRVQQNGSQLHVDCHITMPWYYDLQTTHQELKRIEELFKLNFNQQIELFIHTDPCVPQSCVICNMESCTVRKMAFNKKIEWTIENIQSDKKHSSVYQ